MLCSKVDDDILVGKPVKEESENNSELLLTEPSYELSAECVPDNETFT